VRRSRPRVDRTNGRTPAECSSLDGWPLLHDESQVTGVNGFASGLPECKRDQRFELLRHALMIDSAAAATELRSVA